MSPGADCPSCGKDIGILSVFLAQTPSRIRCPHCKARVRYVGTRRLMWMIAFIAAMIFGFSFVLATYVWKFQNEYTRALVLFGLFFVSWMFVELAVARYLRRNKTLECTPKA